MQIVFIRMIRRPYFVFRAKYWNPNFRPSFQSLWMNGETSADLLGASFVKSLPYISALIPEE